MTAGPTVVVVLHEPSVADLERLARTARAAPRLVVVDNTAEPVPGLADLVGPDAAVLHNANRGGLAGAYNVAARSALGDAACTGVFLLDQDSDVDDDYFATVAEHCAPLAGTPFVAGPRIRETETGTEMAHHPPHPTVAPAPVVAGLRPVEFVISSGCLVSAEAYSVVGPFAEPLVIESIDIEYCLRGWSRGVPTYLDHGVTLGQRTGNLRVSRSGVALDYSPTRQYYRVRNYYWTLREYLPWWEARRRGTRFAVQQGWQVLRRESDRAAKLAAIAAGTWDAWRGRLGPRGA